MQMQTQTPRKLSASILASLPPHLPIKPTRNTFKRNIAISAIAFLSLSSVLSANPNEINLQGGGAAQNIANQAENAIENEVKNEQDSSQNSAHTNQSDYQANSTQDSLIDSLQNPQTTSQDSTIYSTQNIQTNQYDKKSKRYNKLIKHESKYDDLQAKQLDRVVVTAGGYEQDIKKRSCFN